MARSSFILADLPHHLRRLPDIDFRINLGDLRAAVAQYDACGIQAVLGSDLRGPRMPELVRVPVRDAGLLAGERDCAIVTGDLIAITRPLFGILLGLLLPLAAWHRRLPIPATFRMPSRDRFFRAEDVGLLICFQKGLEDFLSERTKTDDASMSVMNCLVGGRSINPD